jgi:menaquinone-dependent protoporphyrinogen oxidase
MKAIIIYHTRYGTTREIAAQISGRLTCQTEIVSVADVESEHFRDADLVVIGGPIYGGSLPGKLTRFCERHRRLLETKRIALYISCLSRDEEADRLLADAFAPWLTARASTAAWLGGRLRMADLRLIDRLVVSKLGALSGDLDRIESERIDRFVGDLLSIDPSTGTFKV